MPITFYSDPDKKIINAELLDEEAEKQAKKFIKDRNKVSVSQIRKFYSEIKALEKQLDYTNNWDEIYPLIKMIKSKISYSTSDSKIKGWEKEVYNNFKEFIVDAIDSIKNKEDFKAFCKYFEAVLGFYYGITGGK